MNRAKEIIEKILYITIATADKNGQPWNSPVYSAFDNNLNFYWFSDKNAQHSKNIRGNKQIFLVIYDSTVPEGTGEGVYIQAEAYELDDKDQVMGALRVLDGRAGKTKVRKYGKFSGDAPLRLYKAIPNKVWVNTDKEDKNGKYIKDMRTELSLRKLTELMR